MHSGNSIYTLQYELTPPITIIHNCSNTAIEGLPFLTLYRQEDKEIRKGGVMLKGKEDAAADDDKWLQLTMEEGILGAEEEIKK